MKTGPENKTQLRFTKDVIGIYNEFHPKGSVIEYHPWMFAWQGMTEAERVGKGIFVECSGMGEFDVYRVGEDVEVTR